jgi:RHS repeat-associated protein
MKYNQAGQEIERLLPGGLTSVWKYDQAGRAGEHKVTRNGMVQHWKKYTWGTDDRLVNIFDAISQGNTHFKHDAFSNLVFAQYADNSMVHRAADATGNFYETKAKTDRKYSSAGALLESENAIYRYDEEGYLVSKTNKANQKRTTYEWHGNGMLKKVVRPDGKEVTYTYDALGRRLSKSFDGKITRWVWDGNAPLHEWTYNEQDKPTPIINEWGNITYDIQEPYSNDSAITWIFAADSLVPAAKIQNGNTYSIIADHLGTPHQMFDEKGNKVWEGVLDIYGRLRTLQGNNSSLPFRYQGQYEDAETGLHYNRFRYYDPESGIYISQDPIGLAGNNPTLYGYVKDTNIWVDIFGLRCNVAKKAKWQSAVRNVEGPGIRDHYAKHGDQVGATSIRQFDASARQTIRDGREFTYRDRFTGARRVGYWDSKTGLFTATTQKGKTPIIHTHFKVSWEDLRKLPGFSVSR